MRLPARAANRRGRRLQRARRNRRRVLAAVSRTDSYRARRRCDHFDSPFRRRTPSALAQNWSRRRSSRTRYVPPSALKDPKLRERVALRAAEIGMVRKEAAELAEALENGLLFPGAELLMPYAYGRALDSVFDYMPPNALLWLVDSGRVLAEANRFADMVSSETAAAARKPAFHPAPDVAVSRGRGVRTRARKFHCGRGRLAGDDGGAARGMGGAGRSQIAERVAARRESTERRADAAELRAARDGTARSPARTGSVADDRRGTEPGRAAAPSSRGV